MVSDRDVRRIALGLPSTTERPSYGTPGFRVADKLFARIREEGDVLVVWCTDLGQKQLLLEADPKTFFTTAHYDGHASVLMRLAAIELDELTELLHDAWRARAPKRLLAHHDAL